MTEEQKSTDEALVEKLIVEVMKVERSFAYEQANAHSRRKGELKAAIENIIKEDSKD